MEEIQLDVQVRNEKGSQKVRKVRREAFIPAVVYGLDQEPTPIKADRKVYERIMRQHQGESVIFHLNVLEGDKKKADYPAILKEVQYHPVNEAILHLDFNRISLSEEIEVKVPVVTRGEAIGVKRDGGTLDHHLWELEVVCLPTNIPQHLEVDISNLGMHDAIHVKDIKLPAGVTTKHDADEIVVSVVGSTQEYVPEEAAAGPAEPEVLKEKKKEEGEAAPAAAKKEEKK